MGIPLGGTGSIPVGGGPVGTGTVAVSAAYPDTIVVYPPDRSGSGTTMAASVGKGTKSGTNTRRNEIREIAEGTSLYNVVVAVDPGITSPDWIVAWTAWGGGTFAQPITLNALGAVEPPGGGATQWTIACERRS